MNKLEDSDYIKNFSYLKENYNTNSTRKFWFVYFQSEFKLFQLIRTLFFQNTDIGTKLIIKIIKQYLVNKKAIRFLF